MTEKVQRELGALALDLKRVTQGFQMKSPKMAERFATEALLTAERLRTTELPLSIKKILDRLPEALSQPNSYERADDALTYSSVLLTSLKR